MHHPTSDLHLSGLRGSIRCQASVLHRAKDGLSTRYATQAHSAASPPVAPATDRWSNGGATSNTSCNQAPPLKPAAVIIAPSAGHAGHDRVRGGARVPGASGAGQHLVHRQVDGHRAAQQQERHGRADEAGPGQRQPHDAPVGQVTDGDRRRREPRQARLRLRVPGIPGGQGAPSVPGRSATVGGPRPAPARGVPSALPRGSPRRSPVCAPSSQWAHHRRHLWHSTMMDRAAGQVKRIWT